MNNIDRKRLNRLYAVLYIPGCHAAGSCTQSMSIKGISGYAHDATFAMPRIKQIICILKMGEDYEGQFEEHMAALEEWHAKRTAEEWAHPSDIKPNAESDRISKAASSF